MRREVSELLALGPLQASNSVNMQVLEKQDALIRSLNNPATDEEACALVQIFGRDECYGLAWTLLHFIESAPSWPIEACLENLDGEWVDRLRQRAINAGVIRGD